MIGAFAIYFWSNESGEPVHVHVAPKRPSSHSVKFWITQDVDCCVGKQQSTSFTT